MKQTSNPNRTIKSTAVEIEVKSLDPTKPRITPENKCSFCHSSKCCQYITTQLDTPRSIKDFDHLLWQISHQNIEIFKDIDGWFLVVNQTCQHLQADGRCGIYEKRPFICREHDNQHCEFDSDNQTGCEHYFDSYQKLDNYCRNRFKNWDKRFKNQKS